MIKIDNFYIQGWEPALRGMRNPMGSWALSDSDDTNFGPNDLKLMNALFKGGPAHRKWMRQVMVWCDITAPLYWWKQFDTYKVGVTTDSTSTMHTMMKRKLTIDDFSTESLDMLDKEFIEAIIKRCNEHITEYKKCENKTGKQLHFYAVIQMLPESFNQMRTVSMSLEAAWKMYSDREDHKLFEWRELCKYLMKKCFFWINNEE